MNKDISEKVLKAEQILQNIDPEDEILLFHSGTANNDSDLKYGVEGKFGEWLEECLSGATDDDELAEEIRNQDPISFYSEEPSWITSKVAKYLGKSVRDVDYNDILENGQLCILVVSKNDTDFKRAGYRDDVSFDQRSRYFNGEIADYNLPFGVEQGDIYSSAGINYVDITLTGNDLITFIDRNYPKFKFEDKIDNKKENKIFPKF